MKNNPHLYAHATICTCSRSLEAIFLTKFNKCRQLFVKLFSTYTNSPSVTNYKQKWDLFSIHFTSQGEYANIAGGRGQVGKGEIGLKTAWGKMLTMRLRQEERRGWRREKERVQETVLLQNGLRRGDYHKLNATLPTGAGETTSIFPIPTHKGMHHLLDTPPNPSNTINRFPLRCKERDSSNGTTKRKNSPPQI